MPSKPPMPNRIDTLVEPMKVSLCRPFSNGPFSEAKVQELSRRDDSMLPSCEISKQPHPRRSSFRRHTS